MLSLFKQIEKKNNLTKNKAKKKKNDIDTTIIKYNLYCIHEYLDFDQILPYKVMLWVSYPSQFNPLRVNKSLKKAESAFSSFWAFKLYMA